MNSTLQIILMAISILFFALIFFMMLRKKLEIEYALVWLITGLIFIIFSFFPSLIVMLSKLLHIIETVNTLFLIIIFFLIIILFTITLSHSKNSKKIKDLAQSVALLESEVRKRNPGSEKNA